MVPGSLLAGRYEILSEIGEGGMGQVYRARRRDDSVVVAVKILRKELMSDAEAVLRFRREAQAASSLTSPHVARILDVGASAEGQPFLVMEYLDGTDLMAEIDHRGALPPDEAASYVLQACLAMIEAHGRGIVHRDLKPSNVFLSRIGSRRVIKVLDFGISKVQALNDAKLTSTRMSFGTPLYMSPEQIRSTKLVDARTDIWSLGVILYEALTGSPPFMAETPGGLAVTISVEPHTPPSQAQPGLPPALDAIVDRALQKDARRRYQTVGELMEALRPFCPEFDPERTDKEVSAFNDTIVEAPAATPAMAKTAPSAPSGKTDPVPPQMDLPPIPTPVNAWSKASPPPRHTSSTGLLALAVAGAGALLLAVAVWVALRAPDRDAPTSAATTSTAAATAATDVASSTPGPEVAPTSPEPSVAATAVVAPLEPTEVDPPKPAPTPPPKPAADLKKKTPKSGTPKPAPTMLVPAAP